MLRLQIALALLALAPIGRAQGGLPPPPPPPHPITFAKTQLGKALFFEEQLSSTGTVACATCHIFSAGSSDPRSSLANPASLHPGFDGQMGTADDVVGSPGVPLSLVDGTYDRSGSFGLGPQVTGRKANSVIMAAYAGSLFWEGRAGPTFRDPLNNQVVFGSGAALESQVVEPPISDVEMGHAGRDWNEVTTKLAAAAPLALASNVPPQLSGWIAGRGYPALFDEAFGPGGVTPVRVAMAIATYERTLIPNQTRFDANQLSPQEQQGLQLFVGTGCATCHGPPVFADNQFHFTGVADRLIDVGRFAVTGANPDRGRFRTPSLRNVELRAPYFHDGSAATLAEVVDFYNRGGDFNGPNKAPQVRPLGLNPNQRAALVAFMRALTDQRVANETAPFDRPTLYSESNHMPTTFGVGTPGSGGVAPTLIALEPPSLGNPNMTLAMEGGLGGARAILAYDLSHRPGGFPHRGTTMYLALSNKLKLKRLRTLGGSGAGDGWGSVTLSLPSDPAAIGRDMYAQWFVFDPAAPRGIAASNAVEFTIF